MGQVSAVVQSCNWLSDKEWTFSCEVCPPDTAAEFASPGIDIASEAVSGFRLIFRKVGEALLQRPSWRGDAGFCGAAVGWLEAG